MANSLIRNLVSFSGLTFISRLLGMVREMVLAYFLPVATGLDIYKIAYRIPNLARELLGEGVLSQALVTRLKQVETEKPELNALKLLSYCHKIFFSIVLVFVGMGIFFTEELISLLAGGDGFKKMPGKVELTIEMTKILFPFLLIMTLASIAMSYLHAQKKFALSAVAPILFNIMFLTVTGYCFYSEILVDVEVLVYATLAAGLVQWLFQAFMVPRAGFFSGFSEWRKYRPEVKKVLAIMAPSILANGSLQINVLVTTYFATFGAGWVSYMDNAFRILLLPIGMFAVALSVVSLPSLAEMKEDKAGSAKLLKSSLSLSHVLSLPCSLAFLFLAYPIISILFERGSYTQADALMTASALNFYAVGLVFYSQNKILISFFYSQNKTTVPMRSSIYGMIINASLSAIFVAVLDLDFRYLCLATVINSIFQSFYLGFNAKAILEGRVIFAFKLSLKVLLLSFVSIFPLFIAWDFVFPSIVANKYFLLPFIPIVVILYFVLARKFILKDIEQP